MIPFPQLSYMRLCVAGVIAGFVRQPHPPVAPTVPEASRKYGRGTGVPGGGRRIPAPQFTHPAP